MHSKRNLLPISSLMVLSLALNEVRAPYSPTLWVLTPDNEKTTLKQCWFPGDHSAVGGGDSLHGLSDITLAWMVQNITNHTKLEYDLRYLLDSRKTFGQNHMNTPWACEMWPDSYVGIYKLAGKKPRTPGKYITLAEEQKGSRTNEYIHKSVFRRTEMMGKAFPHPDLNNLPEDEFGPIENALSW